MEGLSQDLDGRIDENQLNPEDKGIVQKFFDNMNRIRDLKAKLKQLEQEETRLNALLEQENQDTQNRD